MGPTHQNKISRRFIWDKHERGYLKSGLHKDYGIPLKAYSILAGFKAIENAIDSQVPLYLMLQTHVYFISGCLCFLFVFLLLFFFVCVFLERSHVVVIKRIDVLCIYIYKIVRLSLLRKTILIPEY